MARHRLAIVGLGMAVTPHAKGLQDLADRVEVAWAYSPTAARRQAIAERFGFPTCDSLQTILGDDSVDSVLVLTPPNTHLDIARQVAAAGKHLLLEKPLEVSTARAEMLVAACDAAGIVLGIVLQHRFRPAGRRLRALMAEGGLGALIGCSTGIRLWRPQSYYDVEGRGTLARDGGGVLLTQGIHTLDLMLSLTGPVADVAAYARTSPVHRMETEDQVAAAVRFANGALGTIDATTAAYPGYPERIELIFERATAVLAGTELAVHRHDGTVERIAADASPGGTGADPMAFPHDYHRDLIADFVDAVAQGGKPAASGPEGLAVHRLIDALLEAARSGRHARP